MVETGFATASNMEEVCDRYYPGCSITDGNLEGELFDVYSVVRIGVNGRHRNELGPILCSWICASSLGHENHFVEITNTDDGLELVDAGSDRSYSCASLILDLRKWLDDRALSIFESGHWKKTTSVSFQMAVSKAAKEYMLSYDSKYLKLHLEEQRAIMKNSGILEVRYGS